MDVTHILFWFIIVFQFGMTAVNWQGIRKNRDKRKETFENYQQGAKYLQQATELLEDCKKKRANLLTFCEKCKSLIKLKK